MKPKKPTPPSTALRHVYHSVYLQLLLGSVFALLIPAVTQRTEMAGTDIRGEGGMLIFLGLNVWCYLRRYERALAADPPHESKLV